MAIDFSAFDEKVDLQELQNEVQNAPDNDFADVPDGTYIISIEKMEIKLTKAQDKLMFAVQAKIKEGEESFNGGHLAHSELIQQEASGNHVVPSILLMHAEDQLMSAETIKVMALEIIRLNERVKALEKY